MSEQKHSQYAASGVQELIERLRQDGIDAGQQEAQARIATAQKEADEIIKQAKQKAEQIVVAAKVEAQQVEKGGQEALSIAMRDVVLKLKSKLTEAVSEKVKHLIRHKLETDGFLQQLILEVAAKAKRDADIGDKPVKLLLPERLIGLEELQHNPLELKEGSLSHFILSLAADVLREGVTFASSNQLSNGIAIYLKDQDVQLDLTDERIAQVLLEHLQPRFRAILEGMVK